MKFLIRDNFFKSIPKEKIGMVIKNLKYFYEEIEKNSENLKNIPKGFWIKKLSGVTNGENRFEFRVNNGDRIFFSLTKRGMEEENITFVLYSSHDHGVRNSKRAEIINVKDFQIAKNDFEVSNAESLDKSMFLNYNNAVTYEVREDKFFTENTNSKFFYYYLNDEQYNTIISPTPLFIVGSAGSGKSTITLRKILNIEEHNEFYKFKRIGYFTGNSYLKDNISEQYDFFRDKSKEKITEFYTLKEFYKDRFGVDTRRIINYKKFLEFLSFSFPNRKKIGIEDFNIYFEIIGVVKGLMIKGKADNWEKDMNLTLMPLEEYYSLSRKYSVLEKEQKDEIYKIAVRYEEWKNEENLYDIDDLAHKNTGADTEKFDFILVDEVQDLTETEIYFLFNLAGVSQNIVFAGDIHQMVNFNSFSFERLKNLYYKNKMEYFMCILTKNYRSSKEIVKLANYLTDLRKTYIGNLGMDDYKEGAVIEEGNITLSNVDFSYLESFEKNVKGAIIVSDDDERKRISEISGVKHRIFTVEEIKGLEYRDIICCNLISKHLTAWERILSGEVKQDQRYRKYFNLFYVGITRARKNLIIMEDVIDKNELLNKIKDFITFKEKEPQKVKPVEIVEFSNKDEWLSEGIKLYKLEKYDEAQYAFEQADYPSWIAERETEIDIENGDYKTALAKMEREDFKKPKIYFYKLIIDNLMKKEDYIKAMRYLEQFDLTYKYFEIKKKISEKIVKKEYNPKEINKLIPYLINKREHILLGDAYFSIEKYDTALKMYRKVSNWEGMKKTRTAVWKKEFANLPERDTLIKSLENIIGRKDVNTPDKSGETPIYKAVKELHSQDAVRMLLKAGADVNEKTRYKGNMIGYLHWLVLQKDIDKEWIDFFLEEGADINGETAFKETPVYLLGGRDDFDNFKICDYLIEKGADINRPDRSGSNLLSYHTEHRNIKAFKYFLERTTAEHLGDRNKEGKTVEDLFEKMEKLCASLTELNEVKGKNEKRKIDVMKKIYKRYTKNALKLKEK